MIQSFSDILKKYQLQAEKEIVKSLSAFGGQGKLREACEYALMNGGKRVRPALVFMVADALGRKADVSSAALSIEFLHTASLIADDLPCMDNDDMRRNKPSLHKVFGETTALLVSYALISEGNARIAENAFKMDPAVVPDGIDRYYLGALALDNAARNTGVFGTTGGQYLDIFPPELSIAVLQEIIQKKTVSLFEVSLVFGWLFGGGHPGELPKVKHAALKFGMAFQIADDFNDLEQDEINGRKINIVNFLGVDLAFEMFVNELKEYRQALQSLNLQSRELLGLAECLEAQFAL